MKEVIGIPEPNIGKLDELGKNGYKLISIVYDHVSRNKIFYFKRGIVNESPKAPNQF